MLDIWIEALIGYGESNIIHICEYLTGRRGSNVRHEMKSSNKSKRIKCLATMKSSRSRLIKC